MLIRPVAPSVPADSTKPEDIKAWEDYYDACDYYVEMSKPCMDRNW